MAQINVHQAKTQLSKLLDRVAAGEEIIIARAGTPVARLVPWKRDRSPRKLGLFAGQIRIGDDFDELPTDLQRAFEGEIE